MMEDKIQAFCQPLVTATGILLGFILNFMSSWVKSDVPFGDVLAGVVGICMLTGISCLIAVLYRILRMDYPREQGEQYYRRTLSVFVVGVCVAFVGVFIDTVLNFMAG